MQNRTDCRIQAYVDLFEKRSEEALSEQEPRPPTVWRELGVLGIKIAVIVISLATIFTLMYGFHQNADPDMAPTIKTGDLILFYRVDKDYAIGDLLLLDFQGERQVRRVVARAGDTVDIAEGGLIINGATQQEPGIYEQTWQYENGADFPLTVGPEQVFVLGDARENATDSRVYGLVDVENALGSVITMIRRRNL